MKSWNEGENEDHMTSFHDYKKKLTRSINSRERQTDKQVKKSVCIELFVGGRNLYSFFFKMKGLNTGRPHHLPY